MASTSDLSVFAAGSMGGGNGGCEENGGGIAGAHPGILLGAGGGKGGLVLIDVPPKTSQ
jgi:hypothetical protein